MLNNNAFLVGILAIVAGVAVVYYASDTPEPVTVAPAPVAVVEQPFIGPRTKASARAALAALPEIKAWSEHLATSSGGTVKGALIEYGPTPKVIGAKSYWQFSYVENTPEAARRWESFLVGQNSAEILVENDETDQPISLEQWRKDKNPMARKSAL